MSSVQEIRMKEIIVYSTLGCVQCRMAKNFMDDKGISYKSELLDETNLEKIMEESGGTVAPLIKIGEEWVHGFQPDLILEYSGK